MHDSCPIGYGGSSPENLKLCQDKFFIFQVEETLKRLGIIFLGAGMFGGLFCYDYYGNQIVESVRGLKKTFHFAPKCIFYRAWKCLIQSI
jgi:hypothetical protein